ncbi:MAG: endonuclease MutS2, partial [Alistipes sp.]
MIYPENFEQKIGFDIVREQCRAYCTMQRAARMLDEQRFTVSRREVVGRQSLADEMRQMLAMEPNAPTDEFSDIGDIIDKARVEGTFIETADVVRLGKTLASVASTVDFVRSRKAGAYPCMTELSAGVDALPHVVREIARIVDDYGNIRDSASPELATVRREIHMREGQVSKRLQAVLQSAKSAGVVDSDAVISIRDGRAVIPVAASNKRKLSGFIHDESATGKTFYIEPVEVVELNNELRELEYAERREIVRILTAFTDFVRHDVDDMARAEEYIATVDMIRAKARWAVANGGVKPVVAEKGVLRLQSARHPLLAQTLRRNGRELIPLDAELDGKHRILVISGPNAGGKSVCLKTFGLLQYMFQCGFPVTASENSEMPLFRNIYIDIGDQQSIENDLSTYSSHLLNMKAMLAGADDATLVLIDEFGSGTEPIIGAAIAESILERLVASGTFGVITTHYSNIKYFASNTEGVFNGAMMFDVQN